MGKKLELELDDTRRRIQDIEAAVANDKIQLEDGEKWIQLIEDQLNLTVTELIEVEKSLESSKEDNKDLTDERNRLKAAYESLKQKHEIFKKEHEAKNGLMRDQLGGISKFIESLRRTKLNLVETELEMERKGRCDANEKVNKLLKELAKSRAEV